MLISQRKKLIGNGFKIIIFYIPILILYLILFVSFRKNKKKTLTLQERDKLNNQAWITALLIALISICISFWPWFILSSHTGYTVVDEIK